MIKLLKKFYANVAGYFWLPCPVCDEYFGGFEIGNGYVTLSDGAQRCCCKNCDFTAGQIDGLKNKNIIIDARAKKFIDS